MVIVQNSSVDPNLCSAKNPNYKHICTLVNKNKDVTDFLQSAANAVSVSGSSCCTFMNALKNLQDRHIDFFSQNGKSLTISGLNLNIKFEFINFTNNGSPDNDSCVTPGQGVPQVELKCTVKGLSQDNDCLFLPTIKLGVEYKFTYSTRDCEPLEDLYDCFNILQPMGGICSTEIGGGTTVTFNNAVPAFTCKGSGEDCCETVTYLKGDDGEECNIEINTPNRYVCENGAWVLYYGVQDFNGCPGQELSSSGIPANSIGEIISCNPSIDCSSIDNYPPEFAKYCECDDDGNCAPATPEEGGKCPEGMVITDSPATSNPESTSETSRAVPSDVTITCHIDISLDLPTNQCSTASTFISLSSEGNSNSTFQCL